MPGNERTDRLRRRADELDGLDDEITENHIHVHGPAKLEADATGRLKAISMPDSDRETPTDPPRTDPPPKSGLPGIIAAGAGGVVRIVRVASTPMGLSALGLLGLLLLAAFVAWLRLRR